MNIYVEVVLPGSVDVFWIADDNDTSEGHFSFTTMTYECIHNRFLDS